MDLQYLNGLDGYGDGYTDGMEGTGGMEELGKLFKKKAKSGGSSGGGGAGGGKKKKGGIFKKIGGAVKKAGQGIKKAAKKVNLKKVLNVVNKFNPATVALRNGVLASMKLNIGNVGRRLRWSYITPEQAKAKKMDMAKWNKLVEARKKLEKIFYGAGGKPENMKKAILNGKGNKNHEVNGLDGFGAIFNRQTGRFYRPMANNRSYVSPMNPNHPVNRLHKRMPVRQVIGNEMFESENPVGELGELGEPITAATIAAASGVIAAIASTLKKIGDIFGGKGKGSEDFDEEANKEAEKEIPESKNDEDAKAAASIESGGSSDEGSSSSGGSSKSSSSGGSSSDDGGGSSGGSSGGGGGESTEIATTGSGGGDDVSGGTEAPTKAPAQNGEDDGGSGKDNSGGSFMEKNKKWIMPVGIGLGVITVGALIAKAMKPPAPAPSVSRRPMHGVPHKKTNHRRKPKAKPKPKQHKAKPKSRKKGKLSAMTV